jgi:hypothetical protein
MYRILRRACASLALVAALLPVCSFAEPLRLEFGRSDSSVTDIPEMNPDTLRERTLYGLTQATQQAPARAVLVSGGPESADVSVDAKLGRSGQKFRLVYVLKTTQQPAFAQQLAYEFATPKLSNRGVVAMAQDIIAAAEKLEDARKKRLAETPPPPVASAPAPEPTSQPAAPQKSDSAPVASAPADTGYADAQRPEPELRSRPSGRTQLDLGVAAGFNSPSGIFGLEAEYRPVEQVGFNLGGGFGAWGKRISLGARLYPLGARRASPFLEGGMSYNMGSEAYLKSGDYAQYADLLPTPVATASVGLRGAIGSSLYIVPRVGWGWRLRQDNVQTRDGSELNPLLDLAADLSQHGGFLISLTMGVTLL